MGKASENQVKSNQKGSPLSHYSRFVKSNSLSDVKKQRGVV